ncbi:MAG: hypothetical protein WAM07_02025 [Halobacillus sp.]|uniref:hypothetical protein n=1 Tax=Halobacillus sp. TaxID=56800 RepID=UPI003BAF15CA
MPGLLNLSCKKEQVKAGEGPMSGGKKNKPILCRIGFHKFKRMDWEEGTPRVIYKCERCGKLKKVMMGM